jgi:hypothetical protein
MSSRSSNNTIALLAIVFTFASLFANVVLYREASGIIRVTAKAADSGIISFCINAPPRLNASCPRTATAYYGYYCKVKASDLDNESLALADNSSFFEIRYVNSSGIIQFVPLNWMQGRHNFKLTADDRAGCANSVQSTLFNLTILPNYPPNVTGYQPNASSVPTFPKVTIKEANSLRFNVSFFEALNESVSAELLVNNVSRNSTANARARVSYNMHTNFTSAGLYNITIRLWDVFNLSSMVNWTLNVTNVNRPPRFKKQIPGQAWYKNQVKGAFYLNDYVLDPDTDDLLTFRVTYRVTLHNILVMIYTSSNNYVVFSQPAGWTGTELVSFTVTDNWGASDNSNNVTLSVTEPPPESQPKQETGGGGGGGRPRCIEEWFCEKWSQCQLNKTMSRRCVDLNNCGTKLKKPNETVSCVYVPECYDGVQNQAEDGIDCGGPCPPCATCYDLVQNQGEDGIDCGGPCEPCPTEKAAEQAQPSRILLPQPEMTIEKLKEGFVGLGFVILLAALIVLAALYTVAKPRIAEMYKRHVAKAKLAELAKMTMDEQRLLHEQVLAKLDKIESNLDRAPIASSSRNLSGVSRYFFRLLLKLDYEFTYDELKGEILSRKIDAPLQNIAISFFRRITEIEYGGYQLSRPELQSLMDELREIVKLATNVTEARTVYAPKQIGGEKSPEVFNLISDALGALHRDDVAAAKKIYEYVMRCYKKLPDEEKKKIYVATKRLFDEISLAGKKT